MSVVFLMCIKMLIISSIEFDQVINEMNRELQDIADKKRELNEMSQRKMQELSQPHTELKVNLSICPEC